MSLINLKVVDQRFFIIIMNYKCASKSYNIIIQIYLPCLMKNIVLSLQEVMKKIPILFYLILVTHCKFHFKLLLPICV